MPELIGGAWNHGPNCHKRDSCLLFADPKKLRLKFQKPNHLRFCSSIPLESRYDHLAKTRQHPSLFHRKAARFLLRSLARYLELIPISGCWLQTTRVVNKPPVLFDEQTVPFFPGRSCQVPLKNASPRMKQHRDF